jgi:hypothetical protein
MGEIPRREDLYWIVMAICREYKKCKMTKVKDRVLEMCKSKIILENPRPELLKYRNRVKIKIYRPTNNYNLEKVVAKREGKTWKIGNPT